MAGGGGGKSPQPEPAAVILLGGMAMGGGGAPPPEPWPPIGPPGALRSAPMGLEDLSAPIGAADGACNPPSWFGPPPPPEDWTKPPVETPSPSISNSDNSCKKSMNNYVFRSDDRRSRLAQEVANVILCAYKYKCAGKRRGLVKVY